MAKLEKSHYWKADVKIGVSNIAFTTSCPVHRRGMRIEYVEVAEEQSWLKDGNIMFDVGKRLKGWIKEQMRTMKPSLADKLRYSLAGNTKPTFGYISIGTLVDLDGLVESSGGEEFRKPDIFTKYPYRNVFVGENKKYVNSYYYLLPTPIVMEAELFCWTRDFKPDDCKQMLQTFGTGMGIGDMHSQGFGKFILESFNVTSEGDLL